MQNFRVDKESTLLVYLTEAFKNRTQVKKWLKLQRVSVNGKPVVRHDHPLKTGDVIQVGPQQKIFSSSHISDLHIVYKDESILLIEKPEGLLTIATETEKTRTAYYEVNEYLKKTPMPGRRRVFIVHRLDRETSGLLLFARTEEAKLKLQKGWEEVEKKYYAVVKNIPVKKTDTLESFLTENKIHRVFSGPETRNSKHAVTHYTVVKYNKRFALLEIRTDTGRKHQIRVQLADIGHPLVGDERYGGPPSPRLALHASYLRFKHPVTGQYMEFKSALPEAFSLLVK